MLWNPELIRKHDLVGPRYTSYPSAAQFKEYDADSTWHSNVAQSNLSGEPISLYFHIPFCDRICYYCACNKIVTADKHRAERYLNFLMREIELQTETIDTCRTVQQLHWGGGTPTYFNDHQMYQLMQAIKYNFSLAEDDEREYSIEIHPQGIDEKRIKNLRELGFNRISIGVQDFDKEVQLAVNRFNDEQEVEKLVDAVKSNRFKSISVDLMYGLPKQSQNSFKKTLNKIIDISPDRISLFNYAHMPHLFKTQRQINTHELPEPQEKLAILKLSIDLLEDAGYEYIGMDHFAKRSDELYTAQKNGRLHRNFQGYSTHKSCDLFSFGVTSISMFNNVYYQNHKDIELYQESIKKDRIAINKSIELSKDDIIRKTVIDQLICNFFLDFARIEEKFSIDFRHYFANELKSLSALQNDDLLELNNDHIKVQPFGRLLIRRICMEFDSYLNLAQIPQKKYSRII